MLSAYERMIARRYLLPNRTDAFITVISGFSLLGILLGVAALIIVMSVMNGFREELFDRILGVNGHAVIRGYGGELHNYEQLADYARQQPGILRAAPIIEGQVMASHSGRAYGALVRGISRADLERQGIVAEHLRQGSLEDFAGSDAIAIGARLAESLLASVGDRVTLISPEGTATPFGTAPRLLSYRVAAIFEVGVYDYDNVFVFMPLEAAQTFFRLPDAVSGIELVVDDPDKIDIRMAPLRPMLRGVGEITDWRQMNRAFFTALVVERNVMFWILTLIIIVAAFNIISSLIMLVRAKSRDIAILRTMGASKAAVMRVFILTGSLIGGAGTLLGFLLGVVVVMNIKEIQYFVQDVLGAEIWNPEIRFLTEMPASMNTGEVLAIVAIALGLTVLATIYPAWRAARMDPVKVLRYE
ncbi:MAG: lipoprotein-releasing ABC transporter permease subunit [Sphingomonadales bacterium]